MPALKATSPTLYETLEQSSMFISFKKDLKKEVFRDPFAPQAQGTFPVPMDVVQEDPSFDDLKELEPFNTKSCQRCKDLNPADHCRRNYYVEKDPKIEQYSGAVLTNAELFDRLPPKIIVSTFIYEQDDYLSCPHRRKLRKTGKTPRSTFQMSRSFTPELNNSFRNLSLRSIFLQFLWVTERLAHALMFTDVVEKMQP